MARVIHTMPRVWKEIEKLDPSHVLDNCDAHWDDTESFAIQKGREEKALAEAGEGQDVFITLVRADGKNGQRYVCFIAANEEEVLARLGLVEIMTS